MASPKKSTKRFLKLCDQTGHSNKELANILGIDKRLMKEYRNLTAYPSALVLMKANRELGFDLKWIATGEKDESMNIEIIHISHEKLH